MAPLDVDGELDEAVYTTVPAISDFIQQEPNEGLPATERTDVWIFYDDARVYVSFRCWESEPERMIANEMRRDNAAIFSANDNVAFMFDTFYDRRNGVVVEMNALGGRQDAEISDERQFNRDWNPVLDLEVGQFDGGWTVEVAIPFKSLRYRPGSGQVWGFNARRRNLWKNEWSYLTAIPNALGNRGIMQASLAATMVGLEAPPGSKNLDIKPYVIANAATDATSPPGSVNDVTGDFGLDVRYALTQNLTADFTYNTDFAQVEADEQQVNLTRFNLFFPEKREFFLENRGLFQFAGGGGGDTPVLFFSRRIGLDGSRGVPIEAGGRLNGRMGAFAVGLLNIQTEAASTSPATNFSVVRLRRDVLRRSAIGAMFTRRSESVIGLGASDAYGIDGAFAFFDNLAINAYWARTRTEGVSDDDTTSHRVELDYAGDRWGVQLERLMIGEHFTPEVGFLRRDDIRKSLALFRFSPRPASIDRIRKISGTGSVTYIEDGGGRLETRDVSGEFGIEFENSDVLTLSVVDAYELIERPFTVAGVGIPVGGYDFSTARASFTLGQQRLLAGNLFVEQGSFYGGDKTAFGYSRGRVEVTPQLTLEPSVTVNSIELPAGSVTTSLVSSRVTYTVTPLMFASGLLQYNSSNESVGANVRLRWEYQPGSELFIVYNETRDTLVPGFPGLEDRALIVKINRLFRF